jgi:thiol-disulfide isomerase/thioredoxin
MNKIIILFAFSIIATALIMQTYAASAENIKPKKQNDIQKKPTKKYVIVKSQSEKTKPYAEFKSKNIDQKTQPLKKPKIDKTGFKKAPALQDITGYINTDPAQLREAMKNKVILYDFWTYSCYNCQNTFPYVKSWHEKYSDKGLVVVGIHYPEFSFEQDINNVRAAVQNNQIRFPVVLDNDGANWDAFGNHYWPRFYLADHEGYIRYDHIGEGAYDETEKMIQQLIKERNSGL